MNIELLKNDKGTYLIEDNAFKQMAQLASLKVKNIAPAKKANDFIDVDIDKENKLSLTIHIRIGKDNDVSKLCKTLQEEVYETILLMSGVETKNINIDIQGFITEKKA